MKKITIMIGIIIIFSVINTSGCLDYLNINGKNIIYESHPTKISYKISYGYNVNCTGKGKYNIKYDCDKPEVLNGEATIINLLYDQEFSETDKVNNEIISWNISNENTNYYELGINANIETESFLVSNLTGEGAETLQILQTNYIDEINQYCHSQSNGTITFIDLNDILINNIAINTLNKAESNNSFIIAKDLFTWLKQNTNYKKHILDSNIQPAGVTIRNKAGDCDDLSFLYISLCRSINIPARFIRGFLLEENRGNVIAVPHAWVEVFVGGELGNYGWIPVECAGDSSMNTEINQNFGVEDASHLRLFIDDGSDESLNASISGIFMYYDKSMNVHINSFVNINEYNILEKKELCIDEDNTRKYI